MIVDVTLSKKKPARVPVRAVVRRETQKVLHIQIPVRVAGSKKAVEAQPEQKKTVVHTLPPAELHIVHPQTLASEPIAQPEEPAPAVYEPAPAPAPCEPPHQPPADENDEPFFFFEERPPAQRHKTEPVITPSHDEFFDEEEVELDFFAFDPEEIPSSHIEEEYRTSISNSQEKLRFEPEPAVREPIVTEYTPTHDWVQNESEFHKAESIDGLFDFYLPEQEDKPAEESFEEDLSAEESFFEETESFAGDNQVQNEAPPLFDDLDEFFLEDNEFDAFAMFSDEPEEQLSDEGFISYDKDFEDDEAEEDYILLDDELPEEEDDQEFIILDDIEEELFLDAAEDVNSSFDENLFGDDYKVLEIGELESFECDEEESYGSTELLPPVDEEEGLSEFELQNMSEADLIFKRFLTPPESSEDDSSTQSSAKEDADTSQVKYFTRDEHGDQVETSKEDATEIVCYNEESGRPSRYFGVKKNSNYEQ